ncbi:alpha/beta hydrolase [uncultured Formosa sp.]|uniref:alpha/beta hydrolase n=1 Tax=uncultured Formosa sp. TaxID=255435 RepID=UPI0026391735|nr:alpha/beta hydrolase [uncultured Formosa sp.]
MFSQHNTVDTSYTINSAYQKIVKKYSYVSIAKLKDVEPVLCIPNISYKVQADINLCMNAFINIKENRKPAIILIHGGAWKSGVKEMLDPLAQNLAINGFNCFTIDYRLAPQYKFPEAIFDINDAIQFIIQSAEEFKIDSNKIIILGCSAGAQLASLVAATSHSTTFQKEPVHLRALINIDGILAFSHPKSKEGTLAASWIGDTEKNNLNLWNEASALTYIDENCPPTLFIASDFERFQAGRDEMISILKQYNIQYQVKTIHNAPHTFWLFNPWFDEVIRSILNFLNLSLN